MKTYFVIIILISIQSAFSQQKDSISVIDLKQEIKLGAIKMLAGPIFEASYEHIPNTKTGYGGYLTVNLAKGNEFIENYSLTPFYRMYFQNKKDYGLSGFFVEGFTSFYNGDNEVYTQNIEYKFEDFFDISLGLSIGKKWVNTAGFIFELKIGGGRNLLGQDNNPGLFKGDAYIGYRF